MPRPPLSTRPHFSQNETHRNAVLDWLVGHNPESGRTRVKDKHKEVVRMWRPDCGTPQRRPSIATVTDEKPDDRVYVLYDNDPEELLDGYEGKVAISRYQKERLRYAGARH